MAGLNIPAVPPFDPMGNQNTVASRWEKWKKSFTFFVAAAAVNDDNRKRSLLLHLMGTASQEIFETLPNQGDTFDQAIAALDAHFSVKKSVPYERSVFHNAKQEPQESIEQYITRLRKLTTHCEYGESTDDQIRDQVIASCRSSKHRTKFLQEKNLTLQKVIDIGQSIELASHQSKQIANYVRPKRNAPRFNKRQQPPQNNQQQRQHQENKNQQVECGRCGYKNHKSSECRRSKNVKCGTCGKIGHFEKMCRTKRKINQVQQQPDEEDSDSDDDYVFHIDNPPKLKPPLFPINIDGHTVNILIDSGASVNILDEPTFKAMRSKPHLDQTNIRIFTFQANNPLNTVGKFTANVSTPSQNSSVKAMFVVVKGRGGSLLSRQTAEQLDLLRVGPPPNMQPPSEEVNKVDKPVTPTTNILDKHSNIFKGLGCMTNVQVKLHMNQDMTPVQQPIRRVPWHTRQRVDEEIQRLLDSDIIEEIPTNEPTSWLNPYVVVPKKDPSQIRFCLDMRQANKAIVRERHVIPKFEEILPELHDAKVFSKIDLREGYHQLRLHKSSRHVTAFATHKGVYRYKRLFFGISSAFETFQKHVEIALAGCKGARNISDNILIWGKDQEDHDKNLDEALTRLTNRNLKLNKDKCIFSVESLVFAGHRLSAAGISPERPKIEAIKAIQRPTNATEVRSFLGLTIQLGNRAAESLRSTKISTL
uniref:CCHC-type domain-containing protein n=1 Tax=Clytia hemisphaerica TaxID=252671 RepID=A0A7M5UIV2_9CNID